MRTALKGADRHRVPDSRGPGFHGDHGSAVLARRLETHSHNSCGRGGAGDRTAVACTRHRPQSAVLCIFLARRAGGVPWVLLVLLLQRTSTALLEPSLSA